MWGFKKGQDHSWISSNNILVFPIMEGRLEIFMSDGNPGNQNGCPDLIYAHESRQPGYPCNIRLTCHSKTKRSTLYREDLIKNKSPYIGGPL